MRGKPVRLLTVLAAALFAVSPCMAGEEAVGLAPVESIGEAAARGAAIKDALLNAALGGRLLISSKSGAVNQNLKDAIVMSSGALIANVRVIQQEVVGNVMKVHISFDRQPRAAGACDSPGLANVRLSWAGRHHYDENPELTETRRLIAERLQTSLNAGISGHLATGSGSAVYSLQLELEAGGGSAVAGVNYEIRGPHGVRVRGGRIPFDAAITAEEAKRNLGYAILRFRVLSAEAEQAIGIAARALQDIVRCLPAVTQVAFDERGLGSVSMSGPAASDHANWLAFVSWHTPFADDGAIDVLKFDDVADLEGTESGVVTVTLNRRQGVPPKRKGYLVLQ